VNFEPNVIAEMATRGYFVLVVIWGILEWKTLDVLKKEVLSLEMRDSSLGGLKKTMKAGAIG